MKRWISVLFYTLLIYASLPFSRGWLGFLRQQLGSEFSISINLLLLTVGFLTVFWVARKATRLQFLCTMLIFMLLFWITTEIEIPEERLHLLQYSILGYLVAWTIRPIFVGFVGFGSILAIGAFIGLGDEMIQWILPSRVFDWWDVGYNLTGIIFGSTLFHLLK